MREPSYIRLLRRRALALLLGGLLGAALPGPAQGAGPAAARAEAAPVAALLGEVQRLEAEVQRARAQLQQEEREAARDAAEIEQLKAQQAGVARDLQLQQRLAAAQERATRLSQRAAQLRQAQAQLRAARQRLMAGCDRVLADGAAPLAAAQRLELLRLRAAQAEALTAEESPAGIQAAVRSAQAATGAESDDPQLLRERADLLRDSADKMRRELARLEQRAVNLERRRRLRERASSVDEDLFAEQVTSRRANPAGDKSSFNSDAAGGRGAGAPEAAAMPGRAVDAPPPANPGVLPPPASRSGLDPATLDLLRRGDASADPEVKLQALRRAQAELQRLATEFGRRAAALDRRSEELRRRK